MSENTTPSPHIAWVDLTVDNAEQVRDFYVAVLGLQPQPVDMGGYNDYSMVDPVTGSHVLGVCHRQGPNAALPPQWIIYFTVPDLEESIAKAVALGAAIVDGPRAGFCVLRDPGGAITALYQAPPPENPD